MEYPVEFVNDVLDHAKSLLIEQGEFRPFAWAEQVDSPGIIVSDGSDCSDSDSLQQVCIGFERYFVKNLSLKNISKTAVAANVVVQDPRNGRDRESIRLALETYDGLSLYVFFPYTLSEGVLVMDKPFMAKKQPAIFN